MLAVFFVNLHEKPYVASLVIYDILRKEENINGSVDFL
jgi:hypothetical protein